MDSAGPAVPVTPRPRLTLTLFDPTSWSGAPAEPRALGPDGLTIGRAPDNGWVLEDPRLHLSEHHCRIEPRDDQFVLTDTSATGVYINESQAALGFGNAVALTPGDRIALGDYLITVSAADDAARAAAPLDDEAATIEASAEPLVAASEVVPRAMPEDRLPISSEPPSRTREILTLDQPAEALAETRQARTSRTGGRRGGGRDNDPELLVAFLSAAGVGAPTVTRDQARQLMTNAGAALREAIAALQQLTRAERAARGARDDNPLADAPDPETAVARLLGVSRAAPGPADRTLREAVAGVTAQATITGGRRRSRTGAWLAGLCAVLLVGAGAAYYLVSSGFLPYPAMVARDKTPPLPAPTLAPPPVVAPPAAAPAPSVPSPALDRSALRGALAQLFRGFECANLDAEIADDGTVTMTGFVSRGDDLTRLHHDVSALPQVARVDSRATMQPWPFCAVTNLLRTQTADGPTAPVLAPSHADAVYHDGDALIVTATAHDPASRYLTVDYFDTDGKVVHLLPAPSRPDNRLPANQPVTLGAEPDKAARGARVYIVSPPFGSGRVIALSSPRPLFAEPRPEQEDALAYLAALAGALIRDPIGTGPAARITSSQQAIHLVAR